MMASFALWSLARYTEGTRGRRWLFQAHTPGLGVAVDGNGQGAHRGFAGVQVPLESRQHSLAVNIFL